MKITRYRKQVNSMKQKNVIGMGIYKINLLFLTESAMIGLTGGIFGCIIGYIIGFIVRTGMSDSKTQAAIEIVKQISSPEFNVPIMEKGGFVYAGKADYDKSKVSNVMNQLIEAYRSAEAYIPSMDGIAPPAIDLAIKTTAMPGIITGEFDVNEAVAEVQKAAEDYLKAK